MGTTCYDLICRDKIKKDEEDKFKEETDKKERVKKEKGKKEKVNREKDKKEKDKKEKDKYKILKPETNSENEEEENNDKISFRIDEKFNYSYINKNDFPNNKNNINFQQLDSFISKPEIIDSFFENKYYNDDAPYSELKKLEKNELIKQFDNLSKKYKKDFLNKEKPILNLDTNLIENIINNEDTKNVYKNKIIKEINDIKNDKENENYKIEYLTILIIGRKKVGKSTLIKYMLKLNNNEIENKNENKSDDFVVYKSNRITHLRLIEFKGMGYDKNNNPEAISVKAKNFIKERNKSKNYNDFIHCIWYCISGTRLEDLEFDVLNILKKAYKDNEIPIILVYTNENVVNDELTLKMGKYIHSKQIDSEFVKVLAKSFVLQNSGKRIDEFGENDLLNLTLNKCTKALGGKMIRLMINKLSDDIREKMIKINNKNENDLNENIIEEFTQKYKCLLDDELFIDYIINILGRKLTIFYDNKGIYNSSLNYIIKSDIIKNVIEYIEKYKAKTKEIIKTVVKSKAEKFIDYQAIKEKEFGINIRLENKRDLKGFKETNRKFLKQNLYYISQIDLINYIIQNFCGAYFSEYRKILDDFVKELLDDKKRGKDIDKLLKVCFYSKLQDFANKNNIDFKKEINDENIIFQNILPNKNQIHEEVLVKAFENQNSIDLDNNELDKDENENNNNIEENDLWFPLNNEKLKYLNNNNIESLKNFLNKIEYQENYFNLKTFDNPFNKLKEFMKNDLKNFFYLKKNHFIKNLDIQYNEKKLKGDKIPIKNILQNEKASSIYNIKIKNEFDKLKNNKNFVSIDYLTVIVIGKSGVGKSTLINGILKLEGKKIAETYVGRIGTKEATLYINKKVPFLRIIDTRGIEFDKKYGPTQILKKTKEIINNQKLGNKLPCNEEGQIENEDNEKKYNNYISCIWYCVSNNGMDPQEYEILKGLNDGQDILPIIVVYTNALNSEKIKNVRIEVQNKFRDFPFISVLAKPVGDLQGVFGLEELLDITLNMCKKALKGEIFKSIKGLISEEIKKIFKKINENIKNDVNNEIVSKFINDYNKILDDKNFLNYIYKLLEIVFIGYMKNNKEQKKLSSKSIADLENSSMLSNSINDYIKFYKKNDEEFIKEILLKKSLKYLDEQAKKEKYEFKQNIAIPNKNSKKDFDNIIETFLKDNFNFISQKYIIYRLIIDVRESFSEGVEKEINLTIAEILTQNDAYNWSKDIYERKFDDLIEIVKEFQKNIGYGEDNYDKKGKNKKSKFNNLNNSLDEVSDMNYPEAPNLYPKFGNNNS